MKFSEPDFFLHSDRRLEELDLATPERENGHNPAVKNDFPAGRLGRKEDRSGTWP